MDKEELRKKFEANVLYLRRNIPPDDIYMFAEQTFMAALFFIHKWSEWENITEDMKRDPVSNKWVRNIVGLQMSRDKGEDLTLDLDLKSVDDDDEPFLFMEDLLR